jgi:hypothetical protein
MASYTSWQRISSYLGSRPAEDVGRQMWALAAKFPRKICRTAVNLHLKQGVNRKLTSSCISSGCRWWMPAHPASKKAQDKLESGDQKDSGSCGSGYRVEPVRRTRQTSVLRLSFPEWVRHPPWLRTAILHDATYLGGCTTSCRLTSATYLKARGSAAITLTSHGSQGTSHLSCQSTTSLCTRLKDIGGDAPALNSVVQADDRLNANFLKHGDQWRLEALQGTCGLPLSVNRVPTNKPTISAGVRTARA